MRRIPIAFLVVCLMVLGGFMGSLAAQDPDDEIKRPSRRPDLQEEDITRLDAGKAPERAGGGYLGNGAYSDRDWRMISSVHGYDHGYIDGYEQGRRDNLARRNPDPFVHDAYRDAGRGFEDRFQFKIAFQQGYRKGFERGYEDGFQNRESQIATRFFDLEQPGDTATARPRPSPPDLGEPQTPPPPSTVPLRLPEGTPIRARLDQALSTKTNVRGDRFTGKVLVPVIGDNGQVVIPSGSTLRGVVGTVQRPGRVMGRSELNLRFESVVLPNGAEESLVATLVNIGPHSGKERVANGEGTVKGERTVGRDSAIIAGASGIGAAIGAIAGGAKGVAIGAGSGGLIALAGVLATRGKDIDLPSGTEIELQLERPLMLPVFRDPSH